MGNMGMADSEYHEKMMRLGQKRDVIPDRSPLDNALDLLAGCITRVEDDVIVVGKTSETDADVALASVRSEMERLREERDSWVETYLDRGRDLAAAEAEVRRLTEGLREMRQDLDYNEGSVAKFDMKLRALLSASPSDGGGAK